MLAKRDYFQLARIGIEMDDEDDKPPNIICILR